MKSLYLPEHCALVHLLPLQEDDGHAIEVDEAHISEEEKREELEALKVEADLPFEDLHKFHSINNCKHKLEIYHMTMLINCCFLPINSLNINFLS